MSASAVFRFMDAPLAIVVGSVGAVLVAIQMGAVGLLAQDQVDRASAREASARAQRTQVERCLALENRNARAICLRAQESFSGVNLNAPLAETSRVSSQRSVMVQAEGLPRGSLR